MIIALHGLVRCGKDTAADHLVTYHGFIKDSFGGALYREVGVAFEVLIEELQSHEWKTQPVDALALCRCTDRAFIDVVLREEGLERGLDTPLTACKAACLTKPRTSRFILQRWGTEYRRKDNVLYWVEKFERRVQQNPSRDLVVSDVREPHEAACLRRLAAQRNTKIQILEILRDGTINTQHSSDNRLPDHHIDTIVRNGDLAEYLQTITRIVHNVRGIK